MQHEAPLSAEDIAKELGGHREGAGWKCRCPAHDDRNPSLSITEKAGKVVFICRARCSQDAVVAALKERGLWHPGNGHSKPNGRTNGHASHAAKQSARLVTTYDYLDEGGRLVFQVRRYEPKTFRQRRPDGKGEWINNVQGILQVPYRLPELAEAIAKEQPVFVVEGEKDCESLAALHIAATCNAGGAGKWQNAHAVCLKGADVIVLPDNDDNGREHAQAVAHSLRGIARRIRVVDLPGLAPKGDITDWLKAGGTPEQLWEVVDRAPDWQEKLSNGSELLTRIGVEKLTTL